MRQYESFLSDRFAEIDRRAAQRAAAPQGDDVADTVLRMLNGHSLMKLLWRIGVLVGYGTGQELIGGGEGDAHRSGSRRW